MASSLREALESATNEIGELGNAEPSPVIESTPEPSGQTQETETQRAERVRDESGKFARNSTAQTAVTAKPASASPAPSQSASVEPLKAPTSWKKEYWESFAKLPPDIQKYTHERESQFAAGVSTYKTEAESARELRDAITPFMPDLERHGVTPAAWIKDLGTVHKVLVTGTPAEKIAMLRNVAMRNGIPASALATGQVDQVTTQLQPVLDLVQQLQGRVQTYETREAQKEQEGYKSTVAAAKADTATYPHFEAVTPRMIQLLESGAANDLAGAYRIAIRDDDTIWEAEQQRRQDEKARQAGQDRQQRVAAARAKTVSTRSETPGARMADGGAKDRRSTLEAAADAILGGGRI